VVIGIIAVLIGILLPALNKARQQAKVVQCQSNLRSIGQGIQLYTVANKGFLPFGFWEGGADPATSPAGYNFTADPSRASHWALLVQSALAPKYGITWNDMAQGSGGQTGNLAKVREIFSCPEAPPESRSDLYMSASGIHYECHPILMPQLLFPWTPGPTDPTGTHALRAPYKIAKVRRSSEIALIFDAPLDPTNQMRVKYEVPVATAIDNGGIFSSPYLLDTPYSTTRKLEESINMTPSGSLNIYANKDITQNAQTIRFRHKKDTLANALMVDGHVESFTYDPKKKPNDPLVTSMLRRNIYVNPPN
jgi:prepilin-type processing-associated H-X9-DG protein